MRDAWRRVEGPTWLVALAVYGGWIALTVAHRRIPLAIALPCAIFLTAWHSSLQHETIHAMRRVPRVVRTLLGTPPLGLFYPYEWYRAEHVRHHATRDLGSALDPESFALEPARVARLWAPLRAILRANRTLAGRLLFGPALQAARTYRAAFRAVRGGDARARGIWLRHALLVAVVLAGLRLAGVDPLAYLALVAYPAASLGLIRSFAEHRDADDALERTAIVESRSLLSLLFLNNNLHAIHHASPSLPWYELPARYRRECRLGKIAETTPRLRGYRSVARSWLFRPMSPSEPVRLARAESKRIAARA
jgi:fatty acid desaturase